MTDTAPPMLDRSLAIGGIALALLTVTLQYQIKTLPQWAIILGYALGSLCFGVAIGLLVNRKISRRTNRKTALLRLHIFGDHRLPDRLADDNIFRWFYLWTHFQTIDTEGKTETASAVETLFIGFNEDLHAGTLRVSSPDAVIPRYEVKEFNQRFAIIVFSGQVPRCTLEISAS